MKKTFCDHCLKEIRGVEINELDIADCFIDSINRIYVGEGCTLCPECWDKRIQAHINLDMLFLHLNEEGME